MTHVHLISTGGTIVSRDSGAGARAEISVGTLLADIDVEIEESAFLLELVHRHPQPAILTGAQKSADQRDTDGPQNLTDALVSAAHPLPLPHEGFGQIRVVGAKPAGMLSPAQARVLLMLLISQGLTGPELHAAFTSSTF